MTKKLNLKELLKYIEKYHFNWTCNCKDCLNIKKIILEYNQDNIKKGVEK